MDDDFSHHLEIAEDFFGQGLPYWCSDFNRPADEQFARWLKSKGHHIQFFIFLIWDPVYAPLSCELEDLEYTAKIRANLREQGVAEERLPILLDAPAS